jgi:hypothetical protein
VHVYKGRATARHDGRSHQMASRRPVHTKGIFCSHLIDSHFRLHPLKSATWKRRLNISRKSSAHSGLKQCFLNAINVWEISAKIPKTFLDFQGI